MLIAMATIHVIGAGLAGLAAALRLAERGQKLFLYEAAGHAGGRCRTFFDDELGRSIDNGNHLILGANRATFRYLDSIESRATLATAPSPVFPFLDLETGARWTIRPNAGPVPWWIARPGRRAPESHASQYLAAFKLLVARPHATVSDILDGSSGAFKRVFEPLATAVLNAKPEEGAARLFGPVIAALMLGGAKAWRGFVARDGLSASLIDPAVEKLKRLGVHIRFGHRLQAIERSGDSVCGLRFSQLAVALAPDDRIVLAVPPLAAAELVPGLEVPSESRSILNAHFRLDHAAELPHGAPFMGLVGGTAQWLFIRSDIASVTVSAADDIINDSAQDLARRLWLDVATALGAEAATLPPSRIIKERRATFAQIPAVLGQRPGCRTEIRNLFLAGDWTNTALPATIEGAIRSGRRAAQLALG